MNPDTRNAVLKTLLYHSIFEYPLTEHEVYKYAIQEPLTKRHIRQTLTELCKSEMVYKKEDRFYPSQYNYTFSGNYVSRAWNYLQTAQTHLSTPWKQLPFIKCIAVSGSTGALNSDPASDIDLMIITSPHRTWLTRAALLGWLTITNTRINTTKSTEYNQGRFCLNYITAHDKLTIPPEKQDLYSAMEIAHLKVIYNRENSFQIFLRENDWLKQYLPNFWNASHQTWRINSAKNNSNNVSTKPKIERLAKSLQQIYYRFHHNTTPLLKDTRLHDYRSQVMNKYQELVEELHN